MDEQTIIEQIKDVKAHVEQFAKRHEEATAQTDERLNAMVQEVASLVQAKQEVILQQQRIEERLEKAEAAVDKLSRLGVKSQTPHDLMRAAIRDFVRARPDSDAIKAYMDAHAEVHRAVVKELGDAALGGILVSPEFADEILKGVVSVDPMRALATTRPTSSNVYVVRRRTARPTGAWGVGESGTAPESSPRWGEKAIPLHPLSLKSEITLNMLEDTGRDMYAELLSDMQEELRFREGTAFITGTGVQQPMGILNSTDANANVDAFDQIEVVPSPTDGTNKIDFALLTKVYTSLNAVYRANAAWLMNSDGLYDVLNLADAANRLVWTRADASFSVVDQGAPATLLGRPLFISESFESPGEDKLALAFGDFAAGYLIIDKTPVYLVRDNLTKKPNTEILLHMRVGGDVVKGEAIKIGKTT